MQKFAGFYCLRQFIYAILKYLKIILSLMVGANFVKAKDAKAMGLRPSRKTG
ncbi:hypothetical protein HMPREF0322_01793 [Desulfitobacterium hafniense DP7]|uniref:Uncharacterized protein n=1 Tax=Desulfitobacterium hafniense DP7 TaxID=537010 RepID=G9XLF9_DESHA|nr:hypothetical protein HMPREF0322_01793 [Desulfitobacterium hafniense DP7]